MSCSAAQTIVTNLKVPSDDQKVDTIPFPFVAGLLDACVNCMERTMALKD